MTTMPEESHTRNGPKSTDFSFSPRDMHNRSVSFENDYSHKANLPTSTFYWFWLYHNYALHQAQAKISNQLLGGNCDLNTIPDYASLLHPYNEGNNRCANTNTPCASPNEMPIFPSTEASTANHSPDSTTTTTTNSIDLAHRAYFSSRINKFMYESNDNFAKFRNPPENFKRDDNQDKAKISSPQLLSKRFSKRSINNVSNRLQEEKMTACRLDSGDKQAINNQLSLSCKITGRDLIFGSSNYTSLNRSNITSAIDDRLKKASCGQSHDISNLQLPLDLSKKSRTTSCSKDNCDPPSMSNFEDVLTQNTNDPKKTPKISSNDTKVNEAFKGSHEPNSFAVIKKSAASAQNSSDLKDAQSYDKICSYNNARNRMIPNLLKIKKMRYFSCITCKKIFDRPSLLVRHIRVHTGEKPFSCDYCGKCFSTTSSLNTHRRIHTGEKPHICSVCGKKFTASSNLYYHKMTHIKEKPHKCRHCDRSFATPGDLKSHVYTHTGNWPIKCQHCHKGFSKMSNLRNHVILHNDDDQILVT